MAEGIPWWEPRMTGREEAGIREVLASNSLNDGEVTALAGSQMAGAGAFLGIALGSSQAAGYVTRERTLTTWLDELAFVPVDDAADAPLDEWSGDRG